MRGRNARAPIALLALLCAGQAMAATGDVGDMFARFGAIAPRIFELLTVFAYVAGATVVIGGIFALPRVEKGQATHKNVLFRFVTGAALCALGPTLSTMSATIGAGGGEANVLSAGLAAAASGGGGSWCAAVGGMLLFVRLVGVIAIIKGLFMFKSHGEGKDVGTGAAWAHMLGGSAALNIGFTAQVLANTFGLSVVSTVLCLG